MTASDRWLAANRETLHALLASAYGICGELYALPGECDFNLRVECNGPRYLLKIMRDACDPALVEMQWQALERLAERLPDLSVQRLIRTAGGDPTTLLIDHEGRERLAWLVSFLPGQVLGQTRPHTHALLEQIGAALGRLNQALLDFAHPACERQFKWDLRRAAWIQTALDNIADTRRRVLVEHIGRRFVEEIGPRLERLRRGPIHGDANDYNLLVAYDEQGEQRLAGVLDFGDLCRTALVGEPAIAAAYAMMGKEDALAAAESLVAGYHRAFPLQDEELALIFPLILTRLAVSVAVSAAASRERPDDPYVTISEAPAWQLLERFHAYDPNLAEARLRAAAGLDPWPKSSRVVAWLRERSGSFAEALGPARPTAASAIVDLSFASTVGGDDPERFDADLCAGRITEALRLAAAPLGLGRYGEPRPIYAAAAFRAGPHPLAGRRTRHLGIDLFAPAGAPVHAPLDGEVVLARCLPDRLDYGGVVALRHRAAGDWFDVLYGHLARHEVELLHVGQTIAAGQAFATIGERPENGDWPSHLHVQLLIEGCRPAEGPPIGAADPDEFTAWSALSPCPAALLNLSDAAGRWQAIALEALRSRRAARLAANLSIAYGRPLQPVRGWRHFLYDPEGRAYLDVYNNVPHVGHCHPRVVEAATRQMRLLSTNTRYLYDTLTRYADRLVAALPAPLSVCFFVNSGSEANELALRLARAHTGACDLLVMDHGYHGNTTGAMAISPYKFNRPGGPGAADWVHVTPLPDAYRGPFKAADGDAGVKYAVLVEEKIRAVLADGRRIAGYISECAPSVGGQIILPAGFLREVYRCVRQAGGVCIADDVQTALGRLGAVFWGFELQGVVPDILVLGKPLGNGHPLAAVVTTPEIAASFAAGPEFFSTFGGNSVSCAVGSAVLDVLAEEGLQANAARVGAELLSGLSELARRHRLIGDVRGAGLFLGVELVNDRTTLDPATGQASYIKNRLRERRILLGTEGPYDNVLKIRPPMTFDAVAASRLLETLDETLAEDRAQPVTEMPPLSQPVSRPPARLSA
ncbi:MAG: aminotransferase class III-fold pyridoxal phosphate-dependent enzyme [Chloroflexi bacterium]|nr:aminotransferase class III-fold pyridoxal phosphate-dependent enzyme [Chloroflexota bacterium]